MRLSDIQFRPPDKLLRQFAAIWLVFFSAIAAWQGLAHGRTTLASTLAVVAISVGVVGLAAPQAIRWVYVAATLAAFPIGFVVSHVVLAVTYYLLITPIGVLFRLIGRDALQIQRVASPDSYWSAKRMPSDARSYFRQF